MERSFAELLAHVPENHPCVVMINELDKLPLPKSIKRQAVEDSLSLIKSPYGINATQGFLLLTEQRLKAL